MALQKPPFTTRPILTDGGVYDNLGLDPVINKLSYVVQKAQQSYWDFPRDRLLTALKAYLATRDMKADWKSVMTAPPESLVNALSMMCPFEPAEKQALLEAASFQERASTLMALLEMGGAPGPTTLN